MTSTPTAEQYRQMAAAARATGDLTQAARYERKAATAPTVEADRTVES